MMIDGGTMDVNDISVDVLVIIFILFDAIMMVKARRKRKKLVI